MFSPLVRKLFHWTLGIIITAIIAYIFYSKEMEVRQKESLKPTDCEHFHKGTFVFYFNGTKPNKRIIINGTSHLEYENDSNWIQSKITRSGDCEYLLEVEKLNTQDSTRQVGNAIKVKIAKTEQDTMFYLVNRTGIVNKGRLVKISDQANSPLM